MHTKELHNPRNEMNTDQNFLKNLVEVSLEQARKLGASSAEVAVSKGKGFVTTVRMGTVESVEFNRDKSIDVTVYFGNSKGSASSTDANSASIHETIQAACDIAKVTASDPCAGLADKSLMAEGYPDLDLCHPWEIDVPNAIEMATECEAIARSLDPRIVNSEGATLSTHQGVYVYGNSHGFMGSYPSSRHSLSCVLIGKEKEKMQRDYDFTMSRDPKKLWSAERVAKQAVENTVKKLGGRSIKTGSYPVIFRADQADDLIGLLLSAISGRNLYRRSSFLVDAINTQIFPPDFFIEENPLMKSALGSAPFDAEGVRTRAHPIIQAGKLVSYVLSSYSARKLGLQTTGNAGGVHNCIVKTGDKNLKDLLRAMNKGLLITDTMGNGSNITTGDYSQGASGFWVENGEIQYPVEEITIAGNLRSMFQSIQAVGNDVDDRSTILTGSIWIDGMMVAGT